MGDSAHSTMQKITCCPLCGEKTPEAPLKGKCIACNFDFHLLEEPQISPIPAPIQADVPRFSFVMLGLQAFCACLVGFLYLLFADSAYFGLPQLISLIQFTSIFILAIFAFVLHFRKAIFVLRISLMILGVFTLPVGFFSFAAAIAIIPRRRLCIICGKPIKWNSSLDCPHCYVSMHQWGRCRSERFQKVAASLDYEPLQSQIEYTCPNCLKPMSPTPSGGAQNG